jgi:hypothetical protein
VPEVLSPDTPNLGLAATRLRRTLWAWAALFAALGALQWFALRRAPDAVALVASLGLLFVALLVALEPQPAYLALVAVLWGVSLVRLVPGVAAVFGPDVLVALVGDSWLEQLAGAAIRILLMITAWNQFMLYRLLYGTSAFIGGDPDAPVIPEVVPNRTGRLAVVGRLLASAALLLGLAAIPLDSARGKILSLHAAMILATYALGLGLGAAFSPTPRRSVALQAAVIGVIAYLLALAVSAWSVS